MAFERLRIWPTVKYALHFVFKGVKFNVRSVMFMEKIFFCSGMAQKWVRAFKDRRTYVHDIEQTGWPLVITEDLMLKVDGKVKGNKRFTSKTSVSWPCYLLFKLYILFVSAKTQIKCRPQILTFTNQFFPFKNKFFVLMGFSDWS